MSLMASFVPSFFPLDVLDEIWGLIESVSEGFALHGTKYQRISKFWPVELGEPRYMKEAQNRT